MKIFPLAQLEANERFWLHFSGMPLICSISLIYAFRYGDQSLTQLIFPKVAWEG